jgi:hypothetical protein
MKRLHVHVSVGDLADSVRKDDYAKWMLENPRVNFAISRRGGTHGIRHLGIQVEDVTELEEIHARLRRADTPVLEEGATTCCEPRAA